MKDVAARGYDAYKDSGVDWIGEAPSHWRIDRLKRTVNGCINGIWGDEPDGANDVVCIRVADFDRTRNRIVNDKEFTLRAIQQDQRADKLLDVGDLLIEKSGGGERQPVGTVILFDCTFDAVCSNFVARMPVRPEYDPSYLCYLHSALYALRLNIRSIKQNTGIQNLDSTSYLNETVPLPPLPEQKVIADYLDAKTAQIDCIVAAINVQIEKLKELRKTLINDVVTGKIRVI